jgi:hypothetical protein
MSELVRFRLFAQAFGRRKQMSKRKMLTSLAVFFLVMVGACISEYGEYLPLAGFAIWVKLLGICLVTVAIGYWGIDNIIAPEPTPVRGCPGLYLPSGLMRIFGILALLFSLFLLRVMIRTL